MLFTSFSMPPQNRVFRITEVRNGFTNRRGIATGLGSVSLNLEMAWTENQAHGADRSQSVHQTQVTLQPLHLWPQAIQHQHIVQVQVLDNGERERGQWRAGTEAKGGREGGREGERERAERRIRHDA